MVYVPIIRVSVFEKFDQVVWIDMSHMSALAWLAERCELTARVVTLQEGG